MFQEQFSKRETEHHLAQYLAPEHEDNGLLIDNLKVKLAECLPKMIYI